MRMPKNLASISLIGLLLLLQSNALAQPRECHALFNPPAHRRELSTQTRETEARIQSAKIRLAAARSEVFRFAEGRVIHSEIIAPADPSRPTLLLLPGSNRSFTSGEKSVQQLVIQGFGVATMSFSAHPFSVAALPKGEQPAFSKTDLKLEDFAAEVKFVADKLVNDGHATRLIPVSLSYSSSVSPLLKGFKLIVETAPMTSTAAAAPAAAQYKSMLEATWGLNPFIGKTMIRNALDTAYRQTWIPQVDSIIKQYQLDPARAHDITEGYVTLSRASEDFNWANIQVPRETRRIFILGRDDSPSLFRHQLQTFKQINQTTDHALLVVIKEAGHLVPENQAAAYATVFELLHSGQLEKASGVLVITPSKSEFDWKTGSDVDTVINDLMTRIE